MREALFRLNNVEGIGLQAQIREMLVSAILTRQILPGDALPSSRAMASMLQVSRNTVTLAYTMLVDEGYLSARARSGYYISENAPVAQLCAVAARDTDTDALDWRKRMRQIPPHRDRIEKVVNWLAYPYPFLYGQADPGLFSHSEWRDCARQALGLRTFSDLCGDFGYTDDPMLVEYIKTRILPRRGIRAEADEILVTLGAQNALYLIVSLLVTKDTRVLFENPGYPDLRHMIALRTPHAIPVDIDGHGMPADERLRDADLVFVTPSHQSPSNLTMPMMRRQALLAAARQYDAIVIEDDYEFEMSFLSKPLPALKSLDEDGRVLYVGSFSKSVFPGLRLGYLVAPRVLIAEARWLRLLQFRHPPGHVQRTTALFLALGYHDAQIRRQKKAFAERRAEMERGLAEIGLTSAMAPPFGGSSFWIKGPRCLDSRRLYRDAQERGVLIETGPAFFAQKSPPANYFRLGYSSIGVKKIAPGLSILESLINQQLKRR